MTGELRTFKKGAFRIAIANGLPVVPVTIEGTWEVWPPGSKLFFPGRVRARVHEPIATSDLGLNDINGLREKAQEIIAASYEELRREAATQAQS